MAKAEEIQVTLPSETTPQETIRKVVEEGIEARNLLNFIADGSINDLKVSKKPPTSPRPQSVSPKPPIFEMNQGINARLLPRSIKRKSSLSRPKSRLRSASAGRNPDKSLRARYWTFLFENLHRAVDEIYQTCEMDESIVESKEAIMMLENYSKDFHALIQYININKDYEKTAPPNRPTSLAWEVRKSSPGKSLLKNVFIEKLTAGSSNAKRILCFDSPNDITSNTKMDNHLPLHKNVKIAEDVLSTQKIEEAQTEEVIPLDLSNETKKCDIKISIVSAPSDSVFPCNHGLVINEVCCQKSVAPSLETQKEIEIEGENSMFEQNHDDKGLVLKVPDSGSVADTQVFENKPLNDDVAKEITNVKDELDRVDKNETPKRESERESPKTKAPPNKIPVQNIACSKVDNSKSASSDAGIAVKTAVKTADVKSNLRRAPVGKNVKDKVLVSKERPNIEKCQNSTQTTSMPSTEVKIQSKHENCLNSPRYGENLPSSSENSVMSKNIPSKPVMSTKKQVSRESYRHAIKAGNSTATGKVESAKPFLTKKCDEKLENAVEKQKNLKPNSAESAIKRNISYVQSLSSKNRLEKSTADVKKPHRPSSGSLKLTQKSGSMSSLNKTINSHVASRKTLSVEKIPEALKANADDDSDGWEMVRSRNRSRNSPAKKLPFSNKNQDSEAVQIAKLNQSRIGGFPYTNKSNLKSSGKISAKTDSLKKPEKQGMKSEETGNTKSSKLETSLASNKDKKSSSLANSTNLMRQIIHAENNKREINLPKSKIYEVFNNAKSSKIHSNNLSNCISRSSSLPNIYSKVEVGCRKLTKTLCLSDQSLESQKYININNFKKRLSEKGSNSTKKKPRKVKISGSESKEENFLNGSLDESDNGLTSDDQDGTMSHDEFDVQCQELCDAAWKYKILEQQVRKLELSWGEQMDLFDLELRTPGRALEMHEKLSSPFRKKSLLESIRVCNEKQLKAQEQRERLLEEKAQKFKIIEKKRLEMKTLLDERQEKQRFIMEQKLQRAEEKRKKQLQMIIRKAHDEEEKVNEIAFINSLEAQNKRHDLIIKEKDHEARLQDIQEERQRKQEEKAAKEAAAEERRKVLEAERLARLCEMQEKRKMRDHKVEQLFLVKEKERQELANQKARDRELRLSALNAQQQITIEELQKKIQLKQEESARRHEENIEQIRQKAFELSIRRCSSNNDDVPQPVPYETKKICSICNVLIGSEVYLLSHLHGKKHQEAVKAQYQGKDPSSEELELYNLKHIVDASTDQLDPNIALDKERQKALKKRCKKLRQRMTNRGQEYESNFLKDAASVNTNVKNKMEKITTDIKKLQMMKDKNSIDSNLFSTLDRLLNEMEALYKKQLSSNKTAFLAIGGVTALVNMFNIISMTQSGNSTFLNKKTVNHLSAVTESLVDRSNDVCKFILFSNKIGNLLDCLVYRLNQLIPDNFSQLIANNMTKSGETNIKVDVVAWKLNHLLTGILINLSVELSCCKMKESNEKFADFQMRMQDKISYIVSIGIIDKIAQFFNSIPVPINNEEIAGFLLDCIHFLTTLIKLCADCFSGNAKQKAEDTTQLVATVRVTNMVGVVSFLYSLLLHNGSSSRGEEPPPQLPKQIEVLAHSSLQMFNQMAVMNLNAFQSILGSEGLSLQLRHIVSHLLWYCSHLTADNLLHEIIILVGYFTVHNAENQSIIQAGQSPTVLQQLCCLPFLYFSDPELTDILFPTLIACCYNNPENKAILQQEMTSELLSNYIEVKYLNSCDSDDVAKGNKKNSPDIKFHNYWSFSMRFPKNHWSSAKQYFSAQ